MINSHLGQFERAPGIWIPANLSKTEDGNYSVLFTEIANRFNRRHTASLKEKYKVLKIIIGVIGTKWVSFGDYELF